MEELGGLQSTGRKESDMTERLHFHFHLLSSKSLIKKTHMIPTEERKHFFHLKYDENYLVFCIFNNSYIDVFSTLIC